MMRNVMKPIKSNILIHVFLVCTTYILIKQVGHFLDSEKDNQKSNIQNNKDFKLLSSVIAKAI